MTDDTRPLTANDAGARDRFPFGRSEMLLVVGFWLLLAVLTVANRLLDPRGPGFQITLTSTPVALAFVESAIWTLLTPLVFWLAWRFGLDRAEDRLRNLAVLAGTGLVIALTVALATAELRESLFPPPTPGAGERRGGPPFWTVVRVRALNSFLVYIAVLAAGQARAYSLRYRARQADAVRLQAESARLQAQLAEARLDALRMQLDPHFLFNTLHAISSLVDRDPRGVRRMISRLSELLRHSIEGGGEQEIPLRRELELLQRYVDIMQVRFQGRLDVRTSVDDRALDALVPNLILQPIVENAIRHGVSKVEGEGRIEISAELMAGDLVLRVRDNGPGIEDGADASDGSGGVGLRNTRARLSQLYGGDRRLTLRPADGSGTIAELRIPYHTRADIRVAAPATTD